MEMLLVASETGTAEAFARRLHSLLRRRGLLLDCRTLDETVPLADVRLAIFLVSTTGDGQVPTSMVRAWTALRQASLPADLLQDMKFAIFGLGDSSYQHFNAASRKVRARLMQLGAKELCDAGVSDDQSEPEVLFNIWMEKKLLPGLGLDPKLPLAPLELPTRKYSVMTAPLNFVLAELAPPVTSVVVNARLTRLDWQQDVRHIELAPSPLLSFQAGDVCYITPSNAPAGGGALKTFLNTRLDVDPDQPVKFNPPHPFLPDGITPRSACEEFLDMLGVPHADFFECASFFCSNQDERERMLELADGIGYTDYCRRELRSTVQVLLDFPSCALPFAYLIQLVGKIRPRGFSIASSPMYHGNSIHLTVAVVRHLTPNKIWRSGVCSTWLASQKPGASISRIEVRSGTLALPKSLSTPLILIGPGTGMAPMRSLIFQVRLSFYEFLQKV